MNQLKRINIVSVLTVLLLVVVFCGTTPADDLRGKKGLHGKQSFKIGSSESATTTTPTVSLADDPLAIIKEGKMDKSLTGYLSLIDIISRRKTTFRLEEGYNVLNENANYTDLDSDKQLSLDDVPNSSIVRLILIEGQVREIILLQRPS